MGGCDFSVMVAGKDARDAFSGAVEQATYERGHDSYSGTIKEKAGFALLALPPRVTSAKAIGWIMKILGDSGSAMKVPLQHREWARRATAIYDDKWGPALALELSGSELKAAKERLGLKGTRKKVFVFCGVASC